MRLSKVFLNNEGKLPGRPFSGTFSINGILSAGSRLPVEQAPRPWYLLSYKMILTFTFFNKFTPQDIIFYTKFFLLIIFFLWIFKFS